MGLFLRFIMRCEEHIAAVFFHVLSSTSLLLIVWKTKLIPDRIFRIPTHRAASPDLWGEAAFPCNGVS